MGYANFLRNATDRALEHKRLRVKSQLPHEPDREANKEEFYSHQVERLYARAQSELFVAAELGKETARVYVVQGEKHIPDDDWEILKRLQERFINEGFKTEEIVSTATSKETGDFKDVFLIVSW